jgi:hypothetical protein
MAKQLLVLEEVLAMMQVVDISPAKITAFKRQAESVLTRRDTKGHDTVTVTSGFGAVSHKGFIELTIDETRTQMDVKKAVEIAVMMIEAASAATSDTALVLLLRERLGITDTEQIGRILLDLREIRQGTRGTSSPS